MKFCRLLLAAALALTHGEAHSDDLPVLNHDDAVANAGHGSDMMDMDMSTNDTPNNDEDKKPGMPGMDMDMEASPMSMEHHHGRPVLQNPHLEPQQRKYWESYNTTTFFSAEGGNKFALWAHTLLAVVSFALLGTASLICSTDSRAQWLYVPLQTVQSALAILSISFLAIYAPTAPHLYPGNAYAGYSGAMFVLICVHWVAMITRSITSYLTLNEYENIDTHDYRDSPTSPTSEHTRVDSEEYVGEERNAYVLDDMSDTRRNSSTASTEFGGGSETDLSSFDAERDHIPKHILNRQRDNTHHSSSQPAPALVRKLASNQLFVKLNSVVGRFSNFVFNILNYPLFFAGCGYLLVGLATAFLMGKDKKVFALLAHFIKGFIFYALGFVELARFFGVGSSRGWAWNEVYVRAARVTAQSSRAARIRSALWPDFPTFEFIQSFLIFFYGASNVFLEHLGNDDGVWSHKDLQHASIAFMFFGGGLCGMVLESNLIRRLISSAFHLRVTPRGDHPFTADGHVVRSWSLNPMPAFIIFWTGALMSHHQQETELSTQIHIQWGYLFSLAAVIRLFTIALLYVKPRPQSKEEAMAPQRPFTEVLLAFCLVCGGLIFMASNRETVEGMIYRGLDQMFTLNVSVGITVLMMAYFVLCLAIKGFAASRYTR